MNSRTYNIILETSPHTCVMHREIRHSERNYINKLCEAGQICKRKPEYTIYRSKMSQCGDHVDKMLDKEQRSADVYDFPSDSEKEYQVRFTRYIFNTCSWYGGNAFLPMIIWVGNLGDLKLCTHIICVTSRSYCCFLILSVVTLLVL